MKYTTLFYCAIAILATSCSTKQETESKMHNMHNVNDIQNTENVITESTANLEYEIIPLELNESSMMSGAQRIIPTDKYLFILTNEAKIVQFTDKGDFVRLVSSKGRGPQEYVFANDIFINPSKDHIFINDRGGKILEYDFDGNYINSHARQRGITNLIMGNNGLLYEAFRPLRGNELHSMIVTNLDGTVIDSIKNNIKFKFKTRAGVGMYTEHKSLFQLNDEIIFHQHTTDTVFTYKDGELAVRHIFDFGRKLDEEAYNNFAQNMKNMQLLYDYTEDEHFIYPTLVNSGWDVTPYMISKKDNSAYKLDIHLGPNEDKKFFPRWVYDNTLIDYIEQTEDTNISVVKMKINNTQNI